MFGFSIFISKTKLSIPLNKESYGKIKSDLYAIQLFSTGKFDNDKLLYEDDDLIIVLDGVIFNKDEFMTQTASENWGRCVKELYTKDGAEFYNKFRGSFSGALFDKNKKKWIIFTDHIGDKQLYYYSDKENLFISNTIVEILNAMKQIKKNIAINERGAYFLLRFGYMFESYTLFKGVSRINPGCYITIEDDFTITEKTYYVFSNVENTKYLNEDKAVEDFDFYFKQAVERQFSKDKEYGYKHICALSGGLDSRMTSIVAHKLGYEEQINYTFSQNDYWDEIIAKKIASDFHHNFIFHSLNNGLFLFDLEKTTKLTYGNVIYTHVAHGKSFIDLLNFKELGIIHTGQIGGDTIWGERGGVKEYSLKNNHWAYSSKLSTKLSDTWLTRSYDTEELFYVYARGFTGNQGIVPGFEVSETVSPFCDVDFMSFYLTVPWHIRNNRNLQLKWIKEKCPEAGRYIWELTGDRTNRTRFSLLGRKFTVRQFIHTLNRKIRKAITGEANYGMNPFDLYYKSNTKVYLFIHNYYSETIDLVEEGELKEDIKLLFNTGSVTEKLQVLSLLSVYKLYIKA